MDNLLMEARTIGLRFLGIANLEKQKKSVTKSRFEVEIHCFCIDFGELDNSSTSESEWA
jgi:hypothetical protein